MSTDPAHDVTQLLHDASEQGKATDELLELVYEHLRSIAQQRMTGERASHTLQATALVHEAFIKLVGDNDIQWEGRGHFYAAAAQAMRRILIDHARKRNAAKRGGSQRRVPINVVDLASDSDPSQVLAIEEAMTELERDDPRAASIVRMRFFAGLDVEETAKVLGLSERTVLRDWAYARARLFEHISGDSPEQDDDGQSDGR